MTRFPENMVQEVRRILETRPVVVYRDEKRPNVPPAPEYPALASFNIRHDRDRDIIEAGLSYDSGHYVELTIDSADFTHPRGGNIPGGGSLSQLGYWMSILLDEQVLSRRDYQLPSKMRLKNPVDPI